MTDSQPTSERLESLKFRWESDKGSRIFLQLADEYRRLGREADAVAVLEEGLESNPGHVGARVARARCLLALDRSKEAADDLEEVIESDPTQMVAYRLLVEAYIRLQKADKARHRLQVYGLLNDSDPDIEELDKKIRELERAERTGEWPVHAPAPPAGPEEPEAGETEDLSEGSEPAPETAIGSELDEPTAAEETPPIPPSGTPESDEPFGALTPEADLPELDQPAAEPDRPEREAPEAPPTPAAVDPFPVLGLPDDRRRYLSSLGDDLFAAPEEPVDAGDEPEEPAPVEVSTEGDPFDLPSGPATVPADLGEALLGNGADSGSPVEAPEEETPSEIAAAPASPTAPEPALEAEGESEPPFAPVPESPAEAGSWGAASQEPEWAEPGRDGAAPTDSDEAVHSPPQVAEAEPEEDEGRATVTLGRLYLRQGHLDEAGEIFREVLKREPDNEAAQEGLDEVALLRAPSLAAGNLLEGYEPAAHGEGLTARKRYALRQYLERLRGGRSDVH